SYWSAATFGPDAEIFVTINTTPGTDSNSIGLYLRIANPNTASLAGYQFAIQRTAGVFNDYSFARVDNGATTALGANVSGPTLVAGDKFGASITGSTLTIWTKQGAGAWTALATRTDATYASAGNLGVYLQARTDEPFVVDFGGGTAAVADTSPPTTPGVP